MFNFDGEMFHCIMRDLRHAARTNEPLTSLPLLVSESQRREELRDRSAREAVGCNNSSSTSSSSSSSNSGSSNSGSSNSGSSSALGMSQPLVQSVSAESQLRRLLGQAASGETGARETGARETGAGKKQGSDKDMSSGKAKLCSLLGVRQSTSAPSHPPSDSPSDTPPLAPSPTPVAAGREALPIDKYREEILQRVQRDRVVIIHGA